MVDSAIFRFLAISSADNPSLSISLVMRKVLPVGFRRRRSSHSPFSSGTRSLNCRTMATISSPYCDTRFDPMPSTAFSSRRVTGWRLVMFLRVLLGTMLYDITSSSSAFSSRQTFNASYRVLFPMVASWMAGGRFSRFSAFIVAADLARRYTTALNPSAHASKQPFLTDTSVYSPVMASVSCSLTALLSVLKGSSKILLVRLSRCSLK